MNELILYAILALIGIALVYVIAKVRQPIEIREEREKRKDASLVDDIGEIGTILQELKPEIVKGLKLDEKQSESLENWFTTIDKITKSKMLKWGLKRVFK